eukprot:42421-Eustigmatos_ZCMA.PRE.1
MSSCCGCPPMCRTTWTTPQVRGRKAKKNDKGSNSASSEPRALYVCCRQPRAVGLGHAERCAEQGRRDDAVDVYRSR